MKGRVQIETVGSVLLKDNALGDPRTRQVPVYLPPSYGSRPGARYPVIYYLAGFTGNGRTQINHNPWRENLPERLDRLIAAGKAKECVMVFPDCFTALGGSQYLDSPATGKYASHVVDELVPFIEDKLAVRRDAAGRAVMGKSSGGYGALMLAMLRPGVFGHAASHSGDMLFEHCYLPDFPKFVTLLGKHGNSAEKLKKEFLASSKKESYDHVVPNTLAMAACYSNGELPFDERTAELKPAVWRRWKALDPVALAPKRKAALKALKTLWLDCGTRDEFHLHLGARKLSQVLKKLGIKHTYEEHGLGHFDMAERYDVSLTLLSRRLA
jgi:enterochelin esterase family protein